MKIDVNRREHNEPIEVQLSGPLMGELASSFVDDMRQLLGARSLSLDMLCDMQNVEFIDSNGVGALLQLNQEIGGSGRRVVLHSFTPSVRGILELLQMKRVLNICNDLVSAKKMLSQVRS